MALSVAENLVAGLRNRKVVVATITFDSSYPTGGEALTAATLGLSSLDFVIPEQPAGYLVEYDRSNSKLKVYTPTKSAAAHDHTENTDGTYTQNATTATGGAISAAVAPEVANATNLSSLVVRILAIGV